MKLPDETVVVLEGEPTWLDTVEFHAALTEGLLRLKGGHYYPIDKKAETRIFQIMDEVSNGEGIY